MLRTECYSDASENSIPRIPYQILRRSDGVVALSANVGEVAFCPAFVKAQENGSIVIADKYLGACVQLLDVPLDVIATINRDQVLRFIEFGPMGPPIEHELVPWPATASKAAT